MCIRDSSNVLISMFTFDSAAHPGMTCKTPSSFSRELDSGIEPSGGSSISLDEALSYFPTVIKESTKNRKITGDWRHYAVLLTTEESQPADKGMGELQSFVKELDGDVTFTVIGQVSRTYRLNKLVSALGGGLYVVKAGSTLSKAFVEALMKEKGK
eukprot:TRINITY_DN9331_c0_g1_i2.p1 TRINITY_DN9331_c0_g1~~TRINITY_DN9331_c0_g1_i2.p1  ORF type:complete len:156 (+),score=58.52 TRINITY_DN9331_c0_g1_i2:73-540(+)